MRSAIPWFLCSLLFIALLAGEESHTLALRMLDVVGAAAAAAEGIRLLR